MNSAPVVLVLYLSVLIYQIFWLVRIFCMTDLMLQVTETEYAPAKTGEYSSNIPQFSKLGLFEG